MEKSIRYGKVFFMLIVWYCAFIFKVYAAPAQEVTILADESYPPYSFVENSQLKGIYIDIIKAAAKLIEQEYKVNIIAVPWKRGLRELKKGTAFALLPPYKHIEKRNYIWPYSVPIMKEEIVAFCQKNIDFIEYLSPETKKTNLPLIIGINAGYLILNQKIEQAQKINNLVISENKSTSANIMKLYYKRLDCYLNDKLSTLWEISNLTKDSNISFDSIKETLTVMTETAHIGYTNNPAHDFQFKGDFILRMDHALSSLILSNEYQTIIDRYITEK